MADRKDAIVQAWVDERARINRNLYPDCRWCGFPHHPGSACGSTFGAVALGGHHYWIDRSNVDYMLKFVKELPRGFHWRDEVFFERVDGGVRVSRVEPYNNTPHIKAWDIPAAEWDSIVQFAAGVGASDGQTFSHTGTDAAQQGDKQ